MQTLSFMGNNKNMSIYLSFIKIFLNSRQIVLSHQFARPHLTLNKPEYKYDEEIKEVNALKYLG